ncbi:TetR/AcrR family transcriptional regulator C-terminal domain-containing protein [Saccharopolyspora indica]|uniref:TetR/AcrR family transcriptional regulator C-terminal domain-containing protein n=1 Tax=Saccharopolyspora indica TaxID=1229659 RepID=UPI0022EAC5EE|nr:TetR/AcrR family transcriptional regulator C-terminal domain-containing protein [Saccharopolyspora indica]MDA3646291.1 TetR/AcrR family transcriptional regulator C-terminal domain-containing protein [Saccharopolyspora indica]
MPTSRTRGQRAGLTRQDVLGAALAIVDADGLKALSMRRLGAELGVEAMTLYHYVANKDALLDGLVEQLLAEAAVPQVGSGTWQADLRDYAHALRDALLAHPNAIPLVVSRPAVTPRNLEILEGVLRTLRDAGFPLEVGLDVLFSLAGFVVGQVATEVSADGRAEPSEQVRHLSGVDRERFPLLSEAAAAAGDRAGARSRFDFALDAMIAGFAADVTG